MSFGIDEPSDFKPLSSEDIAEIVEQHSKRTQLLNRHRTLAIVSGVELEELTGELLLAFMVENTEASKTMSSVLCSLSAHIQMAYSLGLISPDEYTDLHLIRQIRNYFAHGSEGCSFDDNKVIGLCNQLRIPQQRPDLFKGLSASDIYESTAFVLKQNLATRVYHVSKRRCTVPDEIDSKQWEEFWA